MEKKKRGNKSDLGENFIAPDGGWGWLVCVAGGFSNFCVLPPLLFFGLIYRDKLLQLGLTSSQITTIINVQLATSSCSGLLNGPMFRRFSYRQVALTGAAFISTGIFLSSIANSFTTYILTYSLLYGFGMGISISSTSLALNTYFKEKRRRANSIIWTIAGLSQTFLPYVTTVLLVFYGIQGTVMLYCGLALHIFACALIYQPVKWHINKIIQIPISTKMVEIAKELCEYCKLTNQSKSDQELFTEDEHAHQTNCEVLGTPMLSQANDGWYGSKMTLHSRRKSSLISNRLKYNDNPDIYNYCQCNCSEKETLVSNGNNKISNESKQLHEKIEKEETLELKWYEKVAIFFDLGLLKDFTYVNLLIGGSLAIFAHLNFSILMPFILIDFGFTMPQIAFAMSLHGVSDVIVRFLIPFVTERIKWKNITFFLIGVVGMIMGWFVVSLKPSYEILLVIFIFLGCFKGIRTIFLGLIIPSVVPLKRLPAATGLALLTSGIFNLCCGPFVGMIKDATNFSFTIIFLIILPTIAVASLSIEIIYRNKQMKKLKAMNIDRN